MEGESNCIFATVLLPKPCYLYNHNQLTHKETFVKSMKVFHHCSNHMFLLQCYIVSVAFPKMKRIFHDPWSHRAVTAYYFKSAKRTLNIWFIYIYMDLSWLKYFSYIFNYIITLAILVLDWSISCDSFIILHKIDNEHIYIYGFVFTTVSVEEKQISVCKDMSLALNENVILRVNM